MNKSSGNYILNEDQKDDLESIFKVQDTKREGLISGQQTLNSLKMMGLFPVENIRVELASNSYGVTFMHFCELVQQCLAVKDFDSQVKKCFGLITKGQSDVIKPEILHATLDMLGLKLDKFLLTDLFEQMAGDDNDEISLNDLIKFLKQNGDYVFY